MDYTDQEAVTRNIDDLTKQLITQLECQVKDYEKTYDDVQKRFMESIASRNAHQQEAQTAQKALTRAQATIVTLETNIKDLLSAVQSSDPTTTATRIVDLEKRVASKDGELDYSRQAYQRARQEQQTTDTENSRLTAEVQRLREALKASRSKEVATAIIFRNQGLQDADRAKHIRELQTRVDEQVVEIGRWTEKVAQSERLRPQRATRMNSTPQSPAQRPTRGPSAGGGNGTTSGVNSRRGSPAPTNPHLARLRD